MNKDDGTGQFPKNRSLESVDAYFALSGNEAESLEPEIVEAEIVSLHSDDVGSLDIIVDDSYYREVRPIRQHPGYWEAKTIEPVQPKNTWRFPLFLYLATWICVTLAQGIIFAIAVMTILTCHELGHYLQTRRYKVAASLPYFIPFPSIFGTMGAIIRMDSRIPNTKALFDIGISGPLAGLVPTFLFCFIGAQYADIVPHAAVQTTEPGLVFNEPLLLQWLITFFHGHVPNDHIIRDNPFLTAGWFGLFLTSLNLFPIGQLDGGHVFYAIMKRRAPMLSSFLFSLIIAYVFFSGNWIWAPMIVILYLMNPRHPPTQNDWMPIGLWRSILGWMTLAFIIVGFTPDPITELPPTQPPRQEERQDRQEERQEKPAPQPMSPPRITDT